MSFWFGIGVGIKPGGSDFVEEIPTPMVFLGGGEIAACWVLLGKGVPSGWVAAGPVSDCGWWNCDAFAQVDLEGTVPSIQQT